MDDKYFVPDIEDLRIGYEFEFQGIPKGWHKMIFKEDDSLIVMKYNIEKLSDAIRVPYLTKEQIEAEGWKEISKYNYEKINSNITAYYGDDHYLWIMHPGKTILGEDYLANSFKGECKSINEFRYICKLLKI